MQDRAETESLTRKLIMLIEEQGKEMKEIKQNQQSMHNQIQSHTNIIAAFKEEKTIPTSKNSKPNVFKSFDKETHIIKKKKPNPPTQTPVIAKSLSGST
jgi:septal ring factor EnvC (AmiA/AmiB activator)